MLSGTRVCILLVISSNITKVLAKSSEVVDIREELVLLLKEVVI